ncbi:hypothetical protein THAOC_00615 [Thalassiosira oceanica]|uniref:Uncharacterized protein n=1 Tax=Thalassiosira oceanica TaxID=159749 RepID=K0TRC3_THAOC|nr:hypothetical protein THAOC_00615 [Thalassiosira oceanica]|eukprot:EJK77547.1 hypothetical protein THAOC_00615 [Thalassiosira oceanica]
MFDAPGCPEEGDLYVGPMGSAREHCCYCWMDVPTSAPTISSSPTLTPAPTEPVLCQGSTPNFKDSFGDGCDWYESSDEPGCPHHGNSFFGVMGVANDHCCYCKMSSYLSLTPSSPDIDGYEFKGHGFCTSDDDPFDDGLFGFRIRQAEASTLEECAMACADEHSNDPLFRGVTWMGPYDCFCLVCWEGEEAGVREITGATNLFGGELCYAFTSGSTTESQEPTTTETPVETILGLWESLFGI